MFHSTNVIKGNATKSGNWQPYWILAAILIFLSDSLTLGPKLFSIDPYPQIGTENETFALS